MKFEKPEIVKSKIITEPEYNFFSLTIKSLLIPFEPKRTQFFSAIPINNNNFL